MLHRVILTAASVVALATAANAADMYRPSAGGYKDVPYVGVNWSGLYVGVNGGYGANAASVPSGWLDPAGGFGGGQIGYNVQRGNIVFGVEADIQGGDISDTVAGTVGDYRGNYESKMDWFGTVRARAGYTFDRALVYATGGFAYGNVTNSFCANAGGCISASETQTGWVVGGGVEYKLMPNWSVKGEYQYLDLDASSATGAGPLGMGNGDRTQVNTVRVGLNYFVGGGYEPLK
jgi:outer membrane immunogenic protein